MEIVYLNNEYLPLNEAKVSVMDRGFLFADGVYEVIPVYQGKLFRLQEHIDRLNKSLTGISLPFKMSTDEWLNIFNQLFEKNQLSQQDNYVYLQITRGSMPTRGHCFDDNMMPTVFVQCLQKKHHSLDELQAGCSAITLKDTRWQYCHFKTIALLANVLLTQEASKQGAQDAILIRDGNVIEGAASNVFIVEDGVIITPPYQETMLGGITRDLVLEIAKENNVTYVERNITEQELQHADEIWFTSSTKEIFPIVSLNETAVGDGKPGPVWKKMIALFQEYKCNIYDVNNK
jgi:D-alanine transaminase